MDDLISRAAAIAEIEEYLQGLNSCISEPDLKLDGYRNGLQVAIHELNELPAVDAVPVARVMTLEEVKSSVGNDMYLEISTRTDEMSYITAATLDSAGQKGVVFYCDHFNFVAYNRRLYGWRCWTSRPTYDQMEMTPWQ